MKCTKGSMPKVTSGSAPHTETHMAHPSPKGGNSGKHGMKRANGGHVDSRKTIANDAA